MELFTGTLVINVLITQHLPDEAADVSNWQRLQ